MGVYTVKEQNHCKIIKNSSRVVHDSTERPKLVVSDVKLFFKHVNIIFKNN